MSDLIDRYVHATVRSLPEPRRAEVGRDLAASIGEMVEARTDAGPDLASAERDVLEGLGHPDRLVAQYAERPLHLIGPRYFLVYRRLTFSLLSWVPAVVALLVMVTDIADGQGVGAVLASGVTTAVSTALQVFFWTTLGFALLERSNVDLGQATWTVDSLPAAPTGSRVSLAETLVTVVGAGVLAGLLAFQQVHSWVQAEGGERLPILDPALWSGWIPALIVVLIVTAATEIWTYRRGHLTPANCAVSIVTSLAGALLILWLASESRILNPALVAEFELSAGTVSDINTAVIVTALIAGVLGIVDALATLVRQRR